MSTLRAIASRVERSAWMIFSIVAIVALALTWFRLSFGTGGHDESYYFVSSERLLHGAMPFRDIWEPTLVGYLYSPVIFVHKALHGNIDGIILVLRRSYFVFVLGVALCCFLLVRRHVGAIGAALGLLPLCVLAPWSLYTFSYNTLPIHLVLLSGCFAFCAALGGPGKARQFALISGLAMGLAVVAYPSILLNVLLIGVALFLLKWSQGQRSDALTLLMRYLMGAGSVGLFLIVALSWGIGGIGALHSALDAMVAYKAHERLGVTDVASAGQALASVSYFPLLVLFFFGVERVRGWLDKRRGRSTPNRSESLAAALYLGLLAYVALACYLFRGTWLLVGNVCFALFLAPPLLCLCMGRNRRVSVGLLALIWLPSLVLIVTALVSSWIGVSWRGYFLIGGGLLTIPFFRLLYLEKDHSARARFGVLSLPALSILSFAITASFVFGHFSYVYGDSPIARETAVLTRGPYAGIHTSAELAEILSFIEEEMQAWTSKGESVVLWDMMPIAYAMGHAAICAPSSYPGLKQLGGAPDALYSRYFAKPVCVPDKIVAIKDTVYQMDWRAEHYAAKHGYRLVHERTIEHAGIRVFQRVAADRNGDDVKLVNDSAAADGDDALSAAAGTEAWRRRAKIEFNGDGRADLLWPAWAGGFAVSFMNGAAIESSLPLPGAVASWTLAGVGDFNGDGKTDLLWADSQHPTHYWIYLMKGSATPGRRSTHFGAIGPRLSRKRKIVRECCLARLAGNCDQSP